MEDHYELKDIRQSQVNPKYLHSNSTSHKWAFSAVAELIDNAYDPDVNASRLDINYEPVGNQPCLTFTDDGNGLDAEGMHRMLSFGFSDKKDTPKHQAVGQYGNGFKSGSMRLGRDAIVFSKRYDDRTKTTIKAIGFLSQTFLADIRAETVLAPIVSWKNDQMSSDKDAQPSLQAILDYSIFTTEAELTEQFEKITSHKGTRIIISTLTRDENNRLEFDFTVNEQDIVISEECISNQPALRSGPGRVSDRQTETDIAEHTYSLKTYCSILYMKPKLRIYLRGKRVKTVFFEKSLSQTETDTYRPRNVELESGKQVTMKITFGFYDPKKNQYGVMMYHRNRLIKPFVQVGYQTKPDERGVGVLGVVECNFLVPGHNKQDFDDSKVYRALITALGQKLNDYWNEKKGIPEDKTETIGVKEESESTDKPDDYWVQCNRCQKWRKLPANANREGVDKISEWFCEMNEDPQYSDCSKAEESQDTAEEGPSYVKTFKKKQIEASSKRQMQDDNLGPSLRPLKVPRTSSTSPKGNLEGTNRKAARKTKSNQQTQQIAIREEFGYTFHDMPSTSQESVAGVRYQRKLSSSSIDHQKDMLTEERNRLKQELTGLTEKQATQNRELEVVEKERDMLRNEAKEIKDRMEMFQTTLKEKLDAQARQHQDEKTNLMAEVTKLKGLLSEEKGRHEVTTGQHADTKKKMEEVERKYQNATKSKLELVNKLKEAEEKVCQVEARVQAATTNEELTRSLVAEASNLKRLLSEEKGKYEASTRQHTDTKKKMEEVERKYQKVNKRKTELVNELKEAEEKVCKKIEARVQAAATNEELNRSLAAEVAKLKRLLREERNTLNVIMEENTAIKKNLEEVSQKCREMIQKNGQLEKKLQEAKEKESKTVDVFEMESDSQSRQIQDELQNAQMQATAMNDEQTRILARLKVVTEERDMLRNDKHDLESRMKQYAVSLKDRNGLVTELAELKRLLSEEEDKQKVTMEENAATTSNLEVIAENYQELIRKNGRLEKDLQKAKENELVPVQLLEEVKQQYQSQLKQMEERSQFLEEKCLEIQAVRKFEAKQFEQELIKKANESKDDLEQEERKYRELAEQYEEVRNELEVSEELREEASTANPAWKFLGDIKRKWFSFNS